jgi:cell division protein FtsA
MEDGKIIDNEAMKKSLMTLFSNVRKQTETEFTNVLLVLPSLDLHLYSNHATNKIASNNTVSSQDIESLNKSFTKTKIAENLEIISIYPIKYLVDGVNEYIKPPYGVQGNNIQLTCCVIALPKSVAHSHVRLIESCGVGVSGVVINAAANVKATLFDSEKQDGAFLIDMGGHSTTITFVIQNVITGFYRINLGGENITELLAKKLNLDYEVADELKVRYGSAILNKRSDDPIYFDAMSNSYIYENDVNQYVIQVLEEIFEQIKKGLSTIVKNMNYPLIFTGGSSHIQNLAFKASSYFNQNVRVAKINLLGIRHNSFATSVGAVRDYLLTDSDIDIDLLRIIGDATTDVVTKVMKKAATTD